MEVQDKGSRNLWSVQVPFVTPWREEVVWFEFGSCTVLLTKESVHFPAFCQPPQQAGGICSGHKEEVALIFSMSVLCSCPLGYS